MGKLNKKLEIARESLFVVAGREGQPDIRHKFKILLQLRIDVNSFLRVKSGNAGQEVMNKFSAGARIFPLAADDARKFMRLVAIRAHFLVNLRRLNLFQRFAPSPEVF